MRRWHRVLIAAAFAMTLAACESTQEESARLAAGAPDVLNQKGIKVTKSNRDVEVGDAVVLGADGSFAVAVPLSNRTRKPLAKLPISVEVTDASGKRVFANDSPGLARGLADVPVLDAGEEIVWVNDQVLATGKPAKAIAIVGAPEAGKVRELPELVLSNQRLEDDAGTPVATASVENRSKIDQRQLVVFAVARRAGEIVAAGRAVVPRLRARRKRKFTIFLIGDPKGAKLELAAPPVQLTEEEQQ